MKDELNKKTKIKRIFSNEEKSDMVRFYQSDLMAVRPIAKKFKTRQSTVAEVLRGEGVRIRTAKDSDIVPYTLDKRFFEKIDSEEKAYLLGFLFADGSVAEKSNSISLNLNDLEVLDFFKEHLKIEGKEYYYNPSHDKATSLTFSCREMKEDLTKLGCTPQKSLTVKFPSSDLVPLHLQSHFIRGYFDGDGSVFTLEKSGQFQAKFISSTLFCVALKETLQKNFNIKCGKIAVHNQNDTSTFRITGQENLKAFRSLLYKDCNLFLNRKKEKFDSLK